jgi:hypothetical protein
MLRFLCVGVTAAIVFAPLTASAQPPKDSPAAANTRTKLLKAKVSADFKGQTLRDALKEIAGQVEMQAEKIILWTYGPGFPANEKVTYACNQKPVDEVLDELLKGVKPGLGYYVISDDDGPRDGWIRLTTTGERGVAKAETKKPEPKKSDPVPADADEEAANARLKLAKDLIDGGKPAQAKPVLDLILLKYPKSKAAAEAKDLMEKLPK